MSENDYKAEISRIRENEAQIKEVTKMLIPEEVRDQIADDFENKRTKIWQSEPLPEPEILFLGTQSMKPMQRRNCTAIYFFSGSSGVLMDCAEGTYGQIVDYCENKAQVDAVL